MGLAYLGVLVAAYAAYITLGHALLGAAYDAPWLWKPQADLRSYERAADLRVHRYLFRPLLIGLPFVLALLVWAFWRGPALRHVRTFVRALPVSQRVTLAALALLLLAGQAADDKRSLFPFARWGMYGHAYEPDRMTMYDLYGVTETGERVLINIGRTLPSIQRGAPRRFTETARILRPGPDGAPPSGDLRHLDDVALSIAGLYGSLHGLSFTGVEIVETNVDVEGPRVYRRTTEHVRSVPLRPAGSRD